MAEAWPRATTRCWNLGTVLAAGTPVRGGTPYSQSSPSFVGFVYEYPRVEGSRWFRVHRRWKHKDTSQDTLSESPGSGRSGGRKRHFRCSTIMTMGGRVVCQSPLLGPLVVPYSHTHRKRWLVFSSSNRRRRPHPHDLDEASQACLPLRRQRSRVHVAG